MTPETLPPSEDSLADHGPTAESEEAQDVDPENRTYQRTSLKTPAIIVLGIAVFIVVAGIVGSALASGSNPTFSIHSITLRDGTAVPLTPAATAMKSIVSAGQPPADILGNMGVPTGDPVTHTVNSDGGVSQFDRTVYFTSGLSADQMISLYRALLPRLGWQVIYDGSSAAQSATATEVLAKRGSGDGFYWEAGVVVSPTTSAGVTPYSIELFELPDED